jgi:predicted DNA-binding transcriptional regulator AlpA
MTLLTTKQAAQKLQVSPRTLEKRRLTGDSPKFVRISKRCIRYAEADIDQWLDARKRQNTYEVASE